MAKPCILVDTNIILDVLTKREPFYPTSASLWAAVETRQVDGMIAAHTVTTLFYLITRYASHQLASSAIRDLLKVFAVAPIDQSVLLQALLLGWRDYEDAVQACAATQAGANYLITRNPQDYPDAPLKILTPETFLTILRTLPDDLG
jgi:predicted nucleic acid-binding protein